MDLIRNNPYRLLGLAPTATERQIAKKVHQIRLSLEMGKQTVVPALSQNIPELVLDKELLIDAEGKLHRLQDRFRYSLFAKQIHVDNPISKEHLFYETWCSIDEYLDTFINSIRKDGITTDNFLKGVAQAGETFSSEGFANFIRGYEIPQEWMTPVFQEILRQASVITGLNDVAEIVAPPKYSMLMRSFKDYPSNVKDDLYNKIIKKSSNSIEAQLKILSDRRKGYPADALTFATKLIHNIFPTIAYIQNSELSTFPEVSMLADRVANEVVQCSIDFFNHVIKTRTLTKQEIEESSIIEKKALSIANSIQVKNRIEESIKATESILRELIEDEEVKNSIDEYNKKGLAVSVTVESKDADVTYSYSKLCVCCLGLANKKISTSKAVVTGPNKTRTIELEFPICDECQGHVNKREAWMNSKYIMIFVIMGTILGIAYGFGYFRASDAALLVCYGGFIAIIIYLHSSKWPDLNYFKASPLPKNHTHCKNPVELLTLTEIANCNKIPYLDNMPDLLKNYLPQLQKKRLRYVVRFSNPWYAKRFAASNEGTLSVPFEVKDSGIFINWRKQKVNWRSAAIWCIILVIPAYNYGFSASKTRMATDEAARTVIGSVGHPSDELVAAAPSPTPAPAADQSRPNQVSPQTTGRDARDFLRSFEKQSIEANKTLLRSLEADLNSMNNQLKGLEYQIRESKNQAETYSLNGWGALYNDEVDRHNFLIQKYNRIRMDHNSKLADYRKLLKETNADIDKYNRGN